jgi:hypothetical protein
MTGAVPSGGGTAGEAWHDYLDPGERLLWTGAPAQGLRFTLEGAVGSLGGLFVLAFALLWTAGAGWGLWSGMWREAEGLLRWFLILFPCSDCRSLRWASIRWPATGSPTRRVGRGRAMR